MTKKLFGTLLFSILFLLFFLLAVYTDSNFFYGCAKMTASTGFLLFALACGAFQSRYGIAILLALFFSWWGDLFLIFGHNNIFLMGLIAFFLGHVAFGVAFILHGISLRGAASTLLLLLLPLAYVIHWLNPHLGDMRLPVYAYITVITLMVALSGGARFAHGTWLIPLGAVMFYLSDICVARGRFIISTPLNGIIGLPLYFAAQYILAYSIKRVTALKKMEERHE